MADKLLIYPLDLADFDQTPLPSATEFTDLVNQELGDSASAADGFDAVLEDLTNIINSLEGGLAGLGGAEGGDLDDTFLEALTIDPGPPGDNLVAGTALVPAGDTIVADLGNLLAAVTTPPPPTPKPTGGGGPGGGGFACGELGLVTAVFYVQVDPRSTADVSAPFTYTNRTAAPVTVTAVTFTQDANNQWSWIPNLPQTIAPGGKAVIGTVVNHAGPSGQPAGRLSIVSNSPASPENWCLAQSYTTTPGGPGGGGPGRKL